MKILINFADNNYKKAQKVNSWTGKHIAKFDLIKEYGPEDIEEEFKNKYTDIFSYKRGNGLWIWKPYLIYKTLLKMDKDDILFYADTGVFFCRTFTYAFKMVNMNDFWVYQLPLLEKQFTKPIVFENLRCQGDKYTETNQISGTIIGMKKNEKTLRFVKEWLDFCLLKENITPFHKEEGPFIAHREDQSILSLLCKKYDIKPDKDPTQYGKLVQKYQINDRVILKYDRGKINYRPCIVHHRTGNCNFMTCFKQWLCVILPYKIINKKYNKSINIK